MIEKIPSLYLWCASFVIGLFFVLFASGWYPGDVISWQSLLVKFIIFVIFIRVIIQLALYKVEDKLNYVPPERSIEEKKKSAKPVFSE